LLQIGVLVNDADGPVLAARDMNPSTSGPCGGSCTGVSIGTTKLRFGRLRLQNALGSSTALTLPVPTEAQYWNGSGFVTNSLDSCTTLARDNVTLTGYARNLNPCETRVNQTTISFAGGVGTLTLAAPGATGGVPNSGSVVLVPNLGATPSGNYCPTVGGPEAPATAANREYLQGAWTGSTYTENPSGRASFGLFGSQPKNFIFQRENF
jgi:MSHA biogenesis protein MshQ